MEKKIKLRVDLINVNGLLSIVGMIGVYVVTDGNWWALFWAFIASIHITMGWFVDAVHYPKK